MESEKSFGLMVYFSVPKPFGTGGMAANIALWLEASTHRTWYRDSSLPGVIEQLRLAVDPSIASKVRDSAVMEFSGRATE